VPAEDEDLWEEADATAEQSRVRPPSTPAPPGELPERRVVVIDEGAQPVAPSQASRRTDPETETSEGHAVADIGATLEDDGVPKRRWRLFRKGGE
jgi:hypothetical protein